MKEWFNGLIKYKCTLAMYPCCLKFQVGGMIGSLSGGFVANRFGPKKGLLYVQVKVFPVSLKAFYLLDLKANK